MAPYNDRTYSLIKSCRRTTPASTSSSQVLASCVGPIPNGTPIDTSSIGKKTFSVVATDKAGNSATLVSTSFVK